jgi:D-alanine--poly(phosphoribitol) ligase subunit 2
MKEFLIEKIEEVSFSVVEPDDALWESGILDSITIVELAVEIEEEYDIEVPFFEIIEDNFQTVNLIIQYINRKLEAKNG